MNLGTHTHKYHSIVVNHIHFFKKMFFNNVIFLKSLEELEVWYIST